LAGKGLTRLLIGLGIAILFCFIIPHVIFPALGIGVALPFIYVPGEPIPGTPLTNAFLTTLLTDALLALFIYAGLRNFKLVPGRWQSILEMFVQFLDNLTRNIIGPKNRKVLPLAFSIFTFILFANYIKLIPGFDSVGILECAGPAEKSKPDHPLAPNGYYANGNALFVPSSLNSGYRVTLADYEYCEKVNGKYHGDSHGGAVGTAAATQGAVGTAVATAPATQSAVATAAVGGSGGVSGGGSGGHSSAEPTAEERARAALTRKVDTTPNLKYSTLSAAEKALATAGPNDSVVVTNPLRELYFVTPFLRGPASDLTLTLAIALIAMIAVQVFGVQENGGAYWYKFVNLPALGNMGNPKKPARGLLGPIDFAVGILEIVSEFSKIISFAFRLFGNIFAGQVLLFVMVFLIATGFPLIFIGLEMFVGVIQPFVFAMLFTVFTGIAMAGHHGDDEHHDEEHAHA
jgi:F-type H+-transporting ATPase subunit a